MLVASMGNFIKIWVEIQLFCRWVMLQYTVETVYSTNSNLAKLACLIMQEISIGNINNTGKPDGRKGKHIIRPLTLGTQTDKNKGILKKSLLLTWEII